MAYSSDQLPNGLDAKATPVDADVVVVGDSADSNRAKKTTWAQVKSVLKTYLDTLYQPLSSVLTNTTASFTTAQETKLSGIEAGAEVNTVDSVNGATGVVVLDADDIDDTSTTNKFTTVGDISKLAGIEALADVTDAGNVGSSIHGATGKTTPVDADTTALIDSAASNVLKKVTWANIKATLKTYFDTLYAATAKGVTNGDSHDHSGGDGAQINHTTLSNIGTNTHAQIDTHIASTSNPHSTTADQVLPSQTGNSGKYLTTNGTTSSWGTVAGISDGDKGDITVSGSGTVWTIDDDTIGLDELSATGTPSSSTFLRGDNTWGTPSVGSVEGTSVLSTGETGGVKFLREDGDGTCSWQVPAGSGDVSKVGTPVDNQVGVWTGDGTIEGNSDLTFDGGLNVTVQDAENKDGLTINQNDATNFRTGLQINTATDGAAIAISSTHASSSGPYFISVHESPSPAADDSLFSWTVRGRDSAANSQLYGSFKHILVDPTSTSEDSKWILQTSLAGSLDDRLVVGNEMNGISVGSSSAIGIVSSNGNQDLKLQTGNTTTGSITITDGANGAINITPNGTGEAQVNGEKIIDETDTASDTAAGIVELATTAETNTGTDATRAVTPDALADSKFGTSSLVSGINYLIDGGGSEITTGVKGFIEIPFACTINQVTLLADQPGSIVVDIWKDTYANYPPTDADSITASAVPTISSATKSQDATLTGWTTSVSAGDILLFNVDSATTITRATLSLKVTRV